MKRFLLLFCAAALVCSIMIVPAFAVEGDIINELDDSECVFLVPAEGIYKVAYVCESYDEPLLVTYLTFPIDIDFDDPLVFDIQGKSSKVSFWGSGLSGCVSFSDPWHSCYGNLIFTPVDSIPSEPVPDSPAGSDSEASPLGSIFDVFGGVGSWISGQLGATTSLFWNASTGSLTFLGVLSICAVGFALILLLVLVVSRFLRF